MYNAHVFLGPSLDVKTASTFFPDAHYHPPIQCGDIIRLFRLNPALIVIIDGLYETIPAVWHKEILLAMERGIEVWGAASMGALRAAELHHYGMQGFGKIFHDFKEGHLSDDDEVAVLHLEEAKHFAAINDAMVNIRATCHKAFAEDVLTLDAKNKLLSYCKSQFYPYRSLMKAAMQLAQSDKTYLSFVEWLKKNGVIDLKKDDALSMLKYLHARKSAQIPTLAPAELSKSMTCYLRELILFANTSPFGHNAPWLPTIEQHIYSLHQQSPTTYMLMAEVVSFVQKLIVFFSEDNKAIDNEALINYIHENKLYSPENDFCIYKTHPLLPEIYSLICQAICLLHLTEQQLNDYLPAIAHYYDLPQDIAASSQKILRVILVLIFAINHHMDKPNLLIAKRYIEHHLKQLKNWRRYSQEKLKNWLAELPVSPQRFKALLNAYLRASSVHSLHAGKNEYYQWIYDVYALLYTSTKP